MNWFKQNVVASERKKIEPGATFSLFENHWTQAEDVMKNAVDSDGALAVISHLSQMISFLSVTRNEPPSENSCKNFWLRNKCSDVVIRWLHTMQIKGLQLPLDDELKLVAMLHSLCEAASRDGELLGYLKNSTDAEEGSWDGAYSLASLLLEYSLRNDDIQLSETARYSFLMLIELASRFPGLEKSLTQESGQGLTNVVISGLSACFAQLPTFSEASPEQLQPFIEQIKFVDQVTHAASEKISPLISDCFSNAFLLAVIEPALTQDVKGEGHDSLQTQQDLSYVTSLNEEISIVTFYLQMICQYLTHPLLVRNLFHFINTKLLKLLIHRINHINQSVNVAISSLSLLNVLLEFYCEDFWYEIILQHLISQNHLMVAERNQLLPQISFQESSLKFLSLVPSIVMQAVPHLEISEQYFQYLNQESENWFEFNSSIGVLHAITRMAHENETLRPHNPIYPCWKRKYNGKDNVSESAEDHENGLLEVEDSFPNNEQDSGSDEHQLDSLTPCEDPLSVEVTQFMTISLQNGDSERGKPSTDNQQNGSISFPGVIIDEPTNLIASFGPFLDSIFVELSNWPHLDLDMILMLTRIVTTLASSRIPLITSLLLDSRITIQPCYLTFHTLLKRIRDDLEFQMKDMSPEIIKSIWDWLIGSSYSSSRRVSNGSSSMLAMTGPFPSSSSFSEHLSESIFRKISSTSTTKVIANAFKMFQSPKSPNSRMTTSLSTNFSNSYEPSPTSGYSWHAPSGAGTSKSLDISEPGRSMALRIVLFAHWMMELGAVSQQMCWLGGF